MTVLVDSWAWIEYFKGSEAGKKAKVHMDKEDLIVSTINVAEVFRHFLAHSSAKDAETAIGFMLKASFAIPVDVDIALKAAQIRHERKWGLGDAIVYATAVLKGAKVLTGDSDFKGDKDAIFIG